MTKIERLIDSVHGLDPRIPETTVGKWTFEQVSSSSFIWLKVNISLDEYWDMYLDDESDEPSDEYQSFYNAISDLVEKYYPEIKAENAYVEISEFGEGLGESSIILLLSLESWDDDE